MILMFFIGCVSLVIITVYSLDTVLDCEREKSRRVQLELLILQEQTKQLELQVQKQVRDIPLEDF